MTIHHSIMISSTYKELVEHRAAVSQAALGQGMFPLDMANDAAIPDQDLIDASLAKVDEADAYVGLISYRYGQIEICPRRNPDNYSLTELEFRRAVERKIPICMFIMHEDHPVPRKAVNAEAATADRLDAFTALAKKRRIYAEFKSVDDLKAKVVQTLARLRDVLAQAPPPDPAPVPPPVPPSLDIPAPPAFYAKPPYIPGDAFQGRVKELSAITDWAGSADPVMVFEAIGGMGKSMVTWQWITRHAATEGAAWAGRFWYSFYERGADLRDFCVTALAYMTQQPRKDLESRPTRNLAEDLLRLLRTRPWLLVLDGLERVLVAYHRSDAAQIPDDEVASEPAPTGPAPTSCIRPEDDELLRALSTVAPSKILASSRLMPRALLNAGGQTLPNVRRFQLSGLDPRDAEAMLRASGVGGDGARMQLYLERQFGCHPLVVGVVAGLINKHFKAPGNFDRWVEDPEGGGAVDLADPDIRQRKAHILQLAFAGLDGLSRELMARIAMIANAVDWDILDALNPARPAPPKRQAAPGREPDPAALRQAQSWLNGALGDLERRGLLQCDRQTGTFDLHPVVRGYAVKSLGAEARAETGQRVADYFSTRPDRPFETAATLADLQNGMQTVQALNLAGKTQPAWDALRGGLHRALFRLELHHKLLELLQPLFPGGWSAPPAGVDNPGLVASWASLVLDSVGRSDDARVQQVFSIAEDARIGLSPNLDFRLRNHALGLLRAGELAHAGRILRLARDVAAAVGDTVQTTWCDLYDVLDRLDDGRLADARSLWNAAAAAIRQAAQADGQIEAQALLDEAWLLYREDALTEADLTKAITRVHALGQRVFERDLWRLSGEWHQSNQRDEAAAAAFARAIEMAHEVGLRNPYAEARRALCLARLGRREEAAEAAAAAAGFAPHYAMAELYRTLGEQDKARDHALRGYEQRWADGPPHSWHSWHWRLQACRTVLEALGEPIPDLPPFDPDKIEPLPYEARIRELLAEHAAKHPPASR